MKLPENHQRGINAIATVLEKKIKKMEYALARNKTNEKEITVCYIADISEKKQQQIQQQIDGLYILLEDFCLKYNIPKEKYSLKRELNTAATFLWTDLVNASGKSLKGFGVLDPEIIEEYDVAINQMIEKVNNIVHITI
ncbi:hypothetical protein ACNQGL_09565 [Flavobacterium sp. LB3P21]|uniref:hypothetical protein n=1 Tax=Flavobacterium sp. LB3P21 TaxID=3401719 RepID=UPI003AAC0FB5